MAAAINQLCFCLISLNLLGGVDCNYCLVKLKFFEGRSLGFVILISWGIAFFEYLLMVPANRIGYANGMTGYQLKVMQEVITLGVFVGFAWLVLGERLTWNYAVSFLLILGAVYFAVGVKPAGP